MSETLIIAGRSVRNYQETGETVSRELVRVHCITCDDLLVITTEAAGRIVTHRAAGGEACAICTPCMLHLPRVDMIETSAHGAKLIETRDDAKAVFDAMIAKIP